MIWQSIFDHFEILLTWLLIKSCNSNINKTIWFFLVLLTILTGKSLCFTEFSTKIYWNTRLAASDVFYMFTQSVKGPIIWRFSNRALNFNLLNRIEISSRLNSKLLFKMTFKLHVKIPARYAELKFQLSLAKPRWNSTRNENFKFSI